MIRLLLLFGLLAPAWAAPNDSVLGVTLVADKTGQTLGVPIPGLAPG